MIKLEHLVEYLQKLYAVNNLNDYCPNGLQIEGKDEVKKIATAVSANLKTIEYVVENDFDVLIVHHGIFWQRDSFVIKGTKKKKIQAFLNNDISLIGYHLPMDLHTDVGNNWKAAHEMGWSELQPFGFANNLQIGVKGKIEPTPIKDFIRKLEDYYEHAAFFALGGKEIVESVALVSGGSHKMLSEAAREGVDVFITGSFDEPSWSEAYEEKINFIAMGHSATERIGPRALASHLREKLSVECEFVDVKNPF